MKNLLFLIPLFCINFVSAEELNEVQLDVKSFNMHEYKISTPNISEMKIKKDEDSYEDYLFHPMDYVIKEGKELFFNKEN